MVGLIQACDKFEETRGHYIGFRTYARQKIRWAILDSVRGRKFHEIRRERHAGRIDTSPGDESACIFDRCEDNGPQGSFCGDFDRCDPQPRHDEDYELREALESLTPRQRALVMLRMEGYTQKAAAVKMGISAQAARMLLVRARQALRKRGVVPPEDPPTADPLRLAA